MSSDTTRRDLLAGTAALGAGDVLPFVRKKAPPAAAEPLTFDDCADLEFAATKFGKSLNDWRDELYGQWTSLALAIKTHEMDHVRCAKLAGELEQISEDALPDLVDNLRAAKAWFAAAAEMLDVAEIRLMCGAHRFEKETGA